MLLAIDPGSRPAFAMFDGGELVAVSLTWLDSFARARTIAIEGQWIHHAERGQKILTLAFTAGRQLEAAVRLCSDPREALLVAPRAWRDTAIPHSEGVPKAVYQARVLQYVPGAAERTAAIPEHRRGDALDAIAIGLGALRGASCKALPIHPYGFMG